MGDGWAMTAQKNMVEQALSPSQTGNGLLMTEVYISGVYQMGELGDKLGVRTKWFGEDWPPASFIHPNRPKHISEAIQLSARGAKLTRDQFPERVAVWDEKAFTKTRDVLWVSGFLTVKEKIAEVLSRFNLGGGELVRVPLFQADLVTPWDEPFYYVNYGGPKDSFLPEDSRSASLQISRQSPHKSTYNVFSPADDDVALSSAAMSGAEIWIEKYVFSKLFLSGELVDALLAAKIDVDMRLKKCRIVEG